MIEAEELIEKWWLAWLVHWKISPRSLEDFTLYEVRTMARQIDEMLKATKES